MIPFTVADARPDRLALVAGQEHIEIEHAVERSGTQVRPVEQDRLRTRLLAEPAGVGRDSSVDRPLECGCDAIGEGLAHVLTKVSSGPCSTR